MTPWPALLLVLFTPSHWDKAPGSLTTQILPSITACEAVRDSLKQRLKDVRPGAPDPSVWCQPLAPVRE